MHLRRPAEKLAGCVWLARFVDKARHHLAGTLHPDFVRPFCNPLATDGAFFVHFGIEKEEILRAVTDSAGDDTAVARWFEGRPGCSVERIEAWNALAPNLGREGFPMRRGYLWAMRHFHGGTVSDPRVNSVFTAIACDEGFLDEVAGPAAPAAAARHEPAAPG